ncbi:MAG: hypothetical protein ACKVT0_10715 [Planctomycetaceae bacterium]
MVGKVIRNRRTGQSLDVPTKLLPSADLGKLRELARTVVHPKVE